MSRASESQSLWFAAALLPNGWNKNVRIEVSHGRIARIQTGAGRHGGDEACQLGIPALGNVHSHAFQRAIAGLTEQRRGADTFWSWRTAMYEFVQGITADQLEAVAALAYMEMLEAGITRVGEFHYLHHSVTGAPYSNIAEHAERIAAAAIETGIGLTLLPVMYAHGGVNGLPSTPLQSRFVNSVDSFASLVDACRSSLTRVPFAHVGIAAHSLRAVTPDELRSILPLARGEPIHIHVAEQMQEVEEWIAWCGLRPVGWLANELPLDEHWCLVHATHVTDSELDRLAATQALVGLCPITEANLGDGIFPARKFFARNGRFGIGTDSNVLIDIAEELRLLEYAQRLTQRERNVLHANDERSTGRRLFDEARTGAAQALGAPTGTLETGYIADIIELDATHPSLLNRHGDAWLDSWIFAGARAIKSVWSAGRKVVSAGRHFARDTIVNRYATIFPNTTLNRDEKA